MRCRNDYVKKCKNDLGNSHQSLILWYIWSEPTFGMAAPPFAPLFRAPPFCPPFHFHTYRVEKPKFSTFSRSDPIFLGAQMALPPLFAPPFVNFWKVQNIIYKFCMYHFSSKCVVFALQTQVLKTN